MDLGAFLDGFWKDLGLIMEVGWVAVFQDAQSRLPRRPKQKVKGLTAKRGGGYTALLRFGSAPGPKAPSCVSASRGSGSLQRSSVVSL